MYSYITILSGSCSCYLVTRRQERPINYCFLRDLSSPKSIYVTNFHENKEKLIRRLYKFYNRTVFENKLPAYMDISWNKRLCKTAARTGFRENNGQRYAIIQLSDKVCDSAERLRDTMIHEMCHAACWVIDGNGEYAHHQLWEQYCGKAAENHPDLPLITVLHSWEYHYPVIYVCPKCPYRVGRWTDSLDTKRLWCGYCYSQLVLVT
ncbi:germ cell nuclear acidic protein-like [Dendrobates tinctorius]|uniref:germ cell nuclear acidic protein-like n=1 Tax=Dendrobates tinctorius TaxID=92724 RepID=UPI003CCA568A